MDMDLLKQVFALGMRTAGARLHEQHGNCCLLIGKKEIDEEMPVLQQFISKVIIELAFEDFLNGRISLDQCQGNLREGEQYSASDHAKKLTEKYSEQIRINPSVNGRVYLDDNEYFRNLVKPIDGV